MTSGLRRLQDIAKRGRRVFVFLLIEPDIKLWRATTIYCTQPETFAMMSMAHDWRPCTWWVNAQLEAWMLLGRVFGMVYSCLFSGCEHLFVSFSPAVLLCFEAYPACCSTFACRTAGTAACWAAGLRNGQLPVPVFEASVPPSDSQLQKLLSQRILCVSHFNHVQNARCSTPRRMFERAWNSGSCGIIR